MPTDELIAFNLRCSEALQTNNYWLIFHLRDEPRMVGTQFEKRDLFLNAVPSNVGEDDIKKALAVYSISAIRVSIRQRVNDNTRFCFVTPQSADDFEQMKQVLN